MAIEALTSVNATVESVLALLDEAPADKHSPLLAEFAKAYLRRIPPGSTLSASEWLAEVESLFDYIRVRSEPVAVRVYNPDSDPEKGTVVDINVEDSPFLLDSITNEIAAHGLEPVRVSHPVIGVERDRDGNLVEVGHARHARHKESVQHYELDRRLFDADLPGLERALRAVLADVRSAVDDFYPMMDRVNRMVELARRATGFYPEADIGEGIAFLQWLRDNNFVFLGYREYKVVDVNGQACVTVVPETGLGILSDTNRSHVAEPIPLDDLSPELAARYEKGDLIVITKTNRVSTVHRRVKLDYVGVRIVGPSGSTVGEARLLGLFTSKALMEPASHVPILRRKLSQLVASEDLIEGSHDHKAVIQIFEGFSKYDLFTAPTDELRRVVMGLLTLQETHQLRLFVRRDLLERSVSILVALPRDRFNAELRKRLQDLFMARYKGMSIDYHLELGEADPAQIHFTVWVNGPVPEVDYEELEAEVLALTKTWSDRLIETLERLRPGKGRQIGELWSHRFPDYYTVAETMETAADDVLALDRISRTKEPFTVAIRNESHLGEDLTRLLLYRADGKQPLSELVPGLEDMGMHVIEEVPTRLSGEGNYFIHDFGVVGSDGKPLDLAACRERVSAALTAVWSHEAESDELNQLVISAELTHWEVGIIRAYRVYWRRLAAAFTVGYLNDVLNAFPQIVADLMALFRARFDPNLQRSDPDGIRKRILAALDAIPALDHDRILRSFYRLIEATLRTNAFLPGRTNLAFKLLSAAVPDMPSPVPFAEIFVYGPGVEGVHLRAGPVARGGIRWSDRREDYRTEVLGLMKAQVTKNAVIVPTGAKGGFVLRRVPLDPAAVAAEVKNQYAHYIRALLDVTDNLVAGEVVHPKLRVHDAEDPYLVVAADRGTATFSDLANSIAAEYDFWLDDAFASGGSAGYDHKALGITARGAWKSLERHFLELGINPHETPFTAIGIGDMSGDVFGNGMLGSDRLRLVAAFDHRHIFIDPNPDPAATYAERRRLFELPRSSWDDFDRSVLSAGAGIFPRTLKKIVISPEAQEALGVEQAEWTPIQLLRAILKAPVDLLWNGGIGTYVKATTETHEAVGDRGNDGVRIDASELRARVVVEGGNLGLTQAARVEYALAGGKINTDFIDNSGGVNCSDREVNLKILLRIAEERQGLDRKERDRLVASAADEVVEKILYDNFQQAQMISQEEGAADRRIWAHEQLMAQLEREQILDRGLEGVPLSEVLAERGHRGGKGLTRPELAVLLVDAKRSIYESIVASDLVDDEYLVNDLVEYFPTEVASRYEELIPLHPLRKELIATIVSNDVVNSVGITFVSRTMARSGNSIPEIVKAYRIARDVSGAIPRWEAVESLVGQLPNHLWLELMTGADRVVAALTRRYLTRMPRGGIGEAVAADMAGFADFEETLPDSGPKEWQQAHEKEEYDMVEAGVPADLARRYAYRRQLVHAPDAIAVANRFDRPVSEVAEVMFEAGQAVGLDQLEALAATYKFVDAWQRWALESLEDDMVGIRRELTEAILEGRGDSTPAEAVAAYLEEQAPALRRLEAFIANLDTDQPEDLSPLMIGVRQLRALIG